MNSIKTELDSIFNYLVWDERIVTGGQPDEREIKQLAQQGFSVVMNLGLADAEYALSDEASLVRSLGMDYQYVPVIWDAPREAEFILFSACIRKNSTAKIFIHCAANKRVSVFVALYSIVYCDMDYEKAVHFIEKIWTPNVVWQKFMDDILMLNGRAPCFSRDY